MNLTGQTSGAIFLYDVNADIQKCTFLYNRAALEDGGAVNFQCPDVDQGCNLLVDSCTFISNSAARQGGSITWSDSRPILTNNSFTEGQALYGPDVASFPISIHVLSITGNSTLEHLGTDLDSVEIEGSVLNVGSGHILDIVLTVALFDHYNQTFLIDNSTSAYLLAPLPGSNVIGNTTSTATMGVYSFSGFGVSAPPGNQSMIYVQSSTVSDDDDPVMFSGTVGVLVELRDCEIGESLTGGECLVCPAGKFSLKSNVQCQECLSEAICYGNFTMVPQSGYWRSSIYSDVFYECPYSSSCIGSPVPPSPLSFTGLCAPGYYGNLCSGCLSGYSRQSVNQCVPCPSVTVNSLRMCGIGVGLLLALVIIVKTTINSAKKARSNYSIFIKILLNYLQLVMLTSNFQMKWPSYMKQLFSIQQSAGDITDQIFAVDCFLNNGESDAQAYAVRMKLIGIGLCPLFILCASVLVWLPVSLYKRELSYLKNQLISTFVVCFFLIHPSIVKYMFDFFNCRELNTGEFWMTSYLNIPCWDYIHTRYALIVALPSIIAWGLAVPLLCLAILYKKKSRLSMVEMKLRLGFVYNGYESHKYYWEFVILYRKIVIITIAVFLTNVSTSVQALTVMMVLLLAFGLQVKSRPFALSEMNDLEVRGILVSGVTIYCGLYYMTNDLDPVSQMGMFVLVIVANAYFLTMWSFRIFHTGITILRQKCPCIGRLFNQEHSKILPMNKSLSQVKLGSSFSRSGLEGESVSVSRVRFIQFYESDSVNESPLHRRPQVIEPKNIVPDNSPVSCSNSQISIAQGEASVSGVVPQ